jgi:hypothetical protein
MRSSRLLPARIQQTCEREEAFDLACTSLGPLALALRVALPGGDVHKVVLGLQLAHQRSPQRTAMLAEVASRFPGEFTVA